MARDQVPGPVVRREISCRTVRRRGLLREPDLEDQIDPVQGTGPADPAAEIVPVRVTDPEDRGKVIGPAPVIDREDLVPETGPVDQAPDHPELAHPDIDLAIVRLEHDLLDTDRPVNVLPVIDLPDTGHLVPDTGLTMVAVTGADLAGAGVGATTTTTGGAGPRPVPLGAG